MGIIRQEGVRFFTHDVAKVVVVGQKIREEVSIIPEEGFVF